MNFYYRNFITMATRRYSHSFLAGHLIHVFLRTIIMHGVALCCEDFVAMAANCHPRSLSFEDITNLAFSIPIGQLL